MPFKSKQWKELVLENGKPDRRLYETAVLATLRDRLRSGDVWIERTRNYQRFDEYLLPPADVTTAAAGLPVTTDVDAYIAERAKTLDFRLRRFVRLLTKGKLEGVELRDVKLYVAPLPAITPPEAEKLDRTLDDLQPRIRITELLNDVHRMTGFADTFTELRSGRPHNSPNAVLAAVLADACNLGIEKMADAARSDFSTRTRSTAYEKPPKTSFDGSSHLPPCGGEAEANCSPMIPPGGRKANEAPAITPPPPPPAPALASQYPRGCGCRKS